jgi:hypothetical protein
MEDVPWELFQSIDVKFKVPPLLHVKGQWQEDYHPGIIHKKETISEYEKANEWELRKKITNPYEAIFSGSESNIFPSVASISPLSRSYFKMVEMLDVIKFWDTIPRDKPFQSAHVCEGPGGFLQAIVEEAKIRCLPFEKSYAITLKSTRSYIPGWKKSSKFLKKHPEIQLDYGADTTGNILNNINQQGFCDLSKESAIFTADGGFDFSLDYSKQEELAFPLLLASFTMGLKCLRVGGTMIIKLFDIYSPVTRDLILGTAAQFHSFIIYKPATSRPCNSERYFIAQGYKGIEVSNEWCKHLEIAQTIKNIQRLVTDDWSADILEALQEQIRWQEELQVESINSAISLTKEGIPMKIRQAIQISKGWCQRFCVPV